MSSNYEPSPKIEKVAPNCGQIDHYTDVKTYISPFVNKFQHKTVV